MSVMMSILSSELSFCYIFMLKYGKFFVYFFLFLIFTGVRKRLRILSIGNMEIKVGVSWKEIYYDLQEIRFFCDYLEDHRVLGTTYGLVRCMLVYAIEKINIEDSHSTKKKELCVEWNFDAWVWILWS